MKRESAKTLSRRKIKTPSSEGTLELDTYEKIKVAAFFLELSVLLPPPYSSSARGSGNTKSVTFGRHSEHVGKVGETSLSVLTEPRFALRITASVRTVRL